VKALLQYRASPGFLGRLDAAAKAAGIDVAAVDETDEAAFAREAADCDVLLHVLKPVTAAAMDAAPRLRLIQKLGVGVNTIDLDAARARAIAVANMPGVNSQAVAEMTLMLILATLRRAAYFDALTRRGEGWRPDLAMLDGVGEIAGRTIGFFGYGAVPSRLTPALRALGADVIYHARAAKPEGAGRYVGFDELLASADILSLHTPATPETRGRFDAATLAALKPGAILINTARGELVDEPALVAALQSGQLSAAGLDVFAQEPVSPANPLLAMPHVVLAPHVAWLTPETLDRSLAVAFENCARLRDGRSLLNHVV
jgi:phosphoglycerate dehydrogenase-like enzyme